MHAPAKIIFYESEAIAQGKGELRDGICPRFSDMIPRDRNGVKIPDLPVNEKLLNITHHAQCEFSGENTGVLCLVFLEDISLNSPPHIRQGECFYFSINVWG